MSDSEVFRKPIAFSCGLETQTNWQLLSNCPTNEPQSLVGDKEFQKAIDELRELWKAYRTVHPSRKDKYYRKYVEKLDELAGATHMEIEDITMYI